MLYECQCPHLHRGLPFRSEFEQTVLKHSTETFPAQHHPHLVYVCQGPGGFLWDVLFITALIKQGYRKLDLIFVEPLYETNADILHACLAIKTWCKQNSSDSVDLIPHFYKTIRDYAQACDYNEQLKGHIFITVDPDDKKTVPDFSSLTFRKKFFRIFKKIMRSTSTFYYLYFQGSDGNAYRHMITGCSLHIEHKLCITLEHSYGETSLYERTDSHVFLESVPVYALDPHRALVQIGETTVVNTQLAALL